MALGEWQAGEVVPRRLVPEPLGSDHRTFNTGDLVTRADDGLITVIGRKDRQVKIRGMRVEPYELECALRCSSDVIDAAVIAERAEDSLDVRLIAFVVLAPDAGKTALHLVREHLRACLPSHMQPSRIVVLDTLPLLAGHKIDVHALAARLQAESTVAPPPVGPSPPIPVTLEGVNTAWRSALYNLPFTAADTFEQAGGDSLALLMVVLDLESRFATKLPLERFAVTLRAEDMVQIVQNCLNLPAVGPDSPLVLLKPGSHEPAVFMAHGLDGYAGELCELSRSLSDRRAVYALQVPGLQPEAEGGTTVESLADHFLRAIREVQPSGPYVPVGYRLGGLATLEIARKIRDLGEQIAVLLLIDTYPSPRHWPRFAWMLSLLTPSYRLEPRDIPAAFGRFMRTLGTRFRARRGQSEIPREIEQGSGALRDVQQTMLNAAAAYQPAYYPGRAVFLKPVNAVRDDPHLIWRGLFGELEVEQIMGGHTSMISVYAPNTAARMDALISEAMQ